MSKLVIVNATVVTPLGRKARRGAEMAELHTISHAGVIAEDGIITFVGKMADMPDYETAGCQVIDAEGRCLLPGFVDSHTHLIFGGFRPDEFEWRLKGDTYMSIMERGGGIQSTVNATRMESASELARKARWFIDQMSRMGVTTVEAKSGYGLDTPTEMKMLAVIEQLAQDPHTPLRVVSTFLGAHAVPREYQGRTADYVDLIIDEMLPMAKGKAEFCDIFTERVYSKSRIPGACSRPPARPASNSSCTPMK